MIVHERYDNKMLNNFVFACKEEDEHASCYVKHILLIPNISIICIVKWFCCAKTVFFVQFDGV